VTQPNTPAGTLPADRGRFEPARKRGWAIAVILTLGAVMPAAAPAGASDEAKTPLRVFPADPTDKSIKLGLLPYHELAPQLNELQRASDRVSARVIGQSLQHRDLYQVTVTLPENAAQTRQQDGWRAEIKDNPAAAARNARLLAGYKAPVWINANIHGDEWEGTDAAMRLIRQLATTTDAHALDLLAHTRIVVNLTANPDGRVAGTRENAAGFDLNRDYLTSSQPENVAARDLDIRTQPVYALDLHGYIEGTLIEPSNAPHGRNYEYDLTVKPMYDNALAIEKAVRALGFPEAQNTQIPFRDYADGWDDWSPTLTSAYAPYHGAAAITVELPAPVDDQYYNTLPVAELRHRSSLNTDVAVTAVQTTLDYVRAHRSELIAAQIETFRRGLAGEAQRTVPDGFVPGFGEKDRSSTVFPRGYVIRDGSDVSTARLVNHLIAQDIQVSKAAGSYVVDMHQPKRGLANTLLEAGVDITSRTSTLTDAAVWSLSYLWGASVTAIEDGPLPEPRQPVSTVRVSGGVQASPGDDLGITVRDGNDVSAVNSLLAAGVRLRRAADGSIVAPASAWAAVHQAASTYQVRFTATHATGPVMRRPVIATAEVPGDQISVLRGLGFEVGTVTTGDLTALSKADILYLGSGNHFRWDLLSPEGQAAVRAFARHGSFILQGYGGIQFNEATKLLPVTSAAGRSAASAIVRVTSGSGSLGAAPDYSYVFGPYWFTGLGPGVQVEQRFGPGNPMVAGFWPARKDGAGLATDAAGQPIVVSGTAASGARVVMFGSETLFRAQAKALFAQVASAVYWTAAR
jgi:hypothetical protein